MSDPGDTCGCESCQCDGAVISQIPYERLEEMLGRDAVLIDGLGAVLLTGVIGYTLTGSDHLDRVEQERIAGG